MACSLLDEQACASSFVVSVALGLSILSDGRVQLDEDGKTRSVDVGRERVAKLASDLRANGVTDEDDGCYVPDDPSPTAAAPS